jgi:hypothetical protein
MEQSSLTTNYWLIILLIFDDILDCYNAMV